MRMPERLSELLVSAPIELARDRLEHETAPVELLAIDGLDYFGGKGDRDTGIRHDLRSSTLILRIILPHFPDFHRTPPSATRTANRRERRPSRASAPTRPGRDLLR